MDPMEDIVKKSSGMPHAVCVPWPAQGHINPMMNLAKLLHQKGVHITFVNTDFIHNRLLRSQGPDSLNGLPSFQFMSIPDGLPPSGEDSEQDTGALLDSMNKHCFEPLRDLIFKLNSESTNPPVTCIVSDPLMLFTPKACQHFRIPNVFLWPASASSLMVILSYPNLIEKGYILTKDVKLLPNGYLDTVVEGIPGLEGIRLKNFSLKDPIPVQVIENMIQSASAIVLNTLDDLGDQNLRDALASILPPIYAIGLAHQLVEKLTYKTSSSIPSTLWKEDMKCLKWLDSKEPNSVIYVNFGSILMIGAQQRAELAWGLANSNKNFLWIIRPDLVKGEDIVVPPEFVEETKERGLVADWCPQEEVLKHSSIAGFITHCGWNSMLESVSAGVPMICWPFSADQPINSWYCCNKWGIGMEKDGDVSRDKIEKLVRELMDTEKGKEMKVKAIELKRKAEEAVSLKGSSQLNLDKLIKYVIL